jgi:magnesium chelatase family protein
MRVRARVEKARDTQLARFRRGETSVATNAHLSQRDLERVCTVDTQSRTLLAAAVRQRGLSARAYAKVLRVARTIADLAGSDAIRAPHVSEALAARVLDRDTEERAATSAA